MSRIANLLRGTRLSLTMAEVDQIEIKGLSPEELRGALYALDAVERMARIVAPRADVVPALTQMMVPASKVLADRASIAVTVAKATRRSLPIAAPKDNGTASRLTHGMPARSRH